MSEWSSAGPAVVPLIPLIEAAFLLIGIPVDGTEYLWHGMIVVMIEL